MNESNNNEQPQPLTNQQKQALNECAVAYSYWRRTKGEARNPGWKNMEAALSLVGVDYKGMDEYDRGLLMGIYCAIACGDQLQKRIGYVELVIGGERF